MTAFGPGSWLGIVGGGQLARMMTMEARRMGLRVVVVDPDPLAPAAQVADAHVCAALSDTSIAQRLPPECGIVTFDTEHVSQALLTSLRSERLVRPSVEAISIVQDRAMQRRFLASLGIPQPRTHLVRDAASLSEAVLHVDGPCILKACRSGYDGRGQVVVRDPLRLEDAWRALGSVPAVLERFIEFTSEVSVVLARDVNGDLRFFPLAENEHHAGILQRTVVPARVPSSIEARARDLAERIAVGLDYIGVMAVEMFLTSNDVLLVNEVATRPHNSGHFTLGACATSQFEQHVRAVCGLPLGDGSLLSPAVMLNLFGDLWAKGEPDWHAVLNHPNARLHLYGKLEARPKRKMGHVLICDRDLGRAYAAARSISAQLETKQTIGETNELA